MTETIRLVRDPVTGHWSVDFWCHERSHDRPRCVKQCAECAELTSEASLGVPAVGPIAAAIHYPECWDTAAYPTLADALAEISGAFRCTNDDCAHGVPGAPAPDIAGCFICHRAMGQPCQNPQGCHRTRGVEGRRNG